MSFCRNEHLITWTWHRPLKRLCHKASGGRRRSPVWGLGPSIPSWWQEHWTSTTETVGRLMEPRLRSYSIILCSFSHKNKSSWPGRWQTQPLPLCVAQLQYHRWDDPPSRPPWTPLHTGTILGSSGHLTQIALSIILILKMMFSISTNVINISTSWCDQLKEVQIMSAITNDIFPCSAGSEVHGVQVRHDDLIPLLRQLLERHVTHGLVKGA